MGTILTGETLLDLKEGDRITYHGVRWQVRDRGTYEDDKGYTTQEGVVERNVNFQSQVSWMGRFPCMANVIFPSTINPLFLSSVGAGLCDRGTIASKLHGEAGHTCGERSQLC
jgi:hypothetical protein